MLGALALFAFQAVGLIADRFAREYARLDPVWATYLGIHDHNDRLTRHDDESFEARRRLLAATLAELAELGDPEALAPSDRLDLESLRVGLQWERSRLAQDPRRTDPGLVLDALEVLYTMEIKDYAPPEARTEQMLARLGELPAVLADLRVRLDRPPAVVTRAVIEDLDSAIALVESLGTERRARHAARALRDYQEFLRTEVLPRSDGSPAIGRGRTARLLRDVYGIDDTLEALWARLGAQIERIEREMEALAREIDPEVSLLEVLEAIGADAPRPEEVLETYRAELRALRAELGQSGLFGEIPDDPVVLIRTPEFLGRVVSFAACEPDGVYSTGRTSHFYVTIDLEAPELHARAGIRATVLHEAFPGHHLAASYLRRLPTRARVIFESPIAVEGWATYCEFVAAEEGMLSPVQRLAFLDDQRGNALAAWVDLGLHAGLATPQELREAALQEELDLASFIEDPGYWAAYTLGAWEYQKLRAAVQARLGDRFTLAEFHRRVLGYGPVPPSWLGRELARDWK